MRSGYSFDLFYRHLLVAYVPKGRGAVALGDPIGLQEDRQEVIVGFQQFCQRNDWYPAFYQTLPDNLALYKLLGFKSLMFGQEATVDLKSFTLQGKAGKNLRTVMNRLAKLGQEVQFNQPPISPQLLHKLREVSDEWLKLMHGSEKQFSVNWFDENYLRNCEIALSADGNRRNQSLRLMRLQLI